MLTGIQETRHCDSATLGDMGRRRTHPAKASGVRNRHVSRPLTEIQRLLFSQPNVLEEVKMTRRLDWFSVGFLGLVIAAAVLVHLVPESLVRYTDETLPPPVVFEYGDEPGEMVIVPE
jgi:hypothetical protein